jgi:DNA-binding IclR family transcriptional regulator
VIWLVELSPAEHLTTLVTAVFDRTSLPYSNDWPRNLDNPSILATALGLVALTDHPRTVETHLRHGIPKLTRHTPDQPRQVLAALARTAGEGLAVEHEQVHLGWSCLAIQITGPGSANAVLGVVDRTARFDLGRLRHTALTTAAGIGKEWREKEYRSAST